MCLKYARVAFYIFIANLFVLLVNTLPVDGTNFELTANYFEGDMILSTELQQLVAGGAANKSKRRRRNALLDKDYRWPNGLIYYQISDEFTSLEIKMIHQSMEHISSNTCIRFQQLSSVVSSNFTPPRTFIFIRSSEMGCSAAVGYQGRGGIQYVNLVRLRPNSIGCFSLGIIVHELLHAIGLYHQHSDTDRDDYVRIRNENIRPGMEHNFRKLPAELASSFGVGYDYASVMHYSSYAFSSNGKPTIEPLQPAALLMIGQRRRLSEKDILKIRKMYECK